MLMYIKAIKEYKLMHIFAKIYILLCFVYNKIVYICNKEYDFIKYFFLEYKYIQVHKKSQYKYIRVEKRANTNTNIFGLTKQEVYKYKYKYLDWYL